MQRDYELMWEGWRTTWRHLEIQHAPACPKQPVFINEPSLCKCTRIFNIYTLFVLSHPQPPPPTHARARALKTMPAIIHII